MSNSYKICARCVMDTTDPWISFNAEGVCNHCQHFDEVIFPLWMPNEEGQRYLEAKAAEIREWGKAQEYDCIIGISGGVDSSYLLYVAKEIMHLRPLAVHVDAGWNSEQAVRNIENLCTGLDIDLFTYVVDWDEMRDLQTAYLKAALANQDVPQDHAFFAKLYELAIKKGIKYVLTGSNYATESILPRAWGYNAKDSRQLKAIHRKFGSVKLRSFPISGLFKSYIYYPYIRRMKVVTPLNYLPYDKEAAMAFLTERFQWQYYGGKHFESRWTKFFQSYYLPTKFGYDKRRAHLSSLIVSGQLAREDAIEELQQSPYDMASIADDIQYVSKKLELDLPSFHRLLALPNKDYTHYPNSRRFENLLRMAKRVLIKSGLLR